MKKQFLKRLSGIIPATVLFLNVNAQVAKASLETNLKEFVFNEATSNMLVTKDGRVVNVNARAERDFMKRFGFIGKVNWFEIKDGIAARFEANGVDYKAFYDEGGRWYSTVLTYQQSKLPKDVLKLVRSTYYDYSIYVVNEIIVGEKTAYLVKIESEDNFKSIRVIDGEMDVYEDYLKNK
ncbi:MAG: hypothetical protein ABUT20_12070 [Bacteroidota bacterium]